MIFIVGEAEHNLTHNKWVSFENDIYYMLTTYDIMRDDDKYIKAEIHVERWLTDPLESSRSFICSLTVVTTDNTLVYNLKEAVKGLAMEYDNVKLVWMEATHLDLLKTYE